MFDLTKEWRAKLEPRELPGGDLVVAEIRYEKGGNLRPYFAITGATYARETVRGMTKYGRVGAGEKPLVHEGVRYWPDGPQGSDVIAPVYPELASAMRWHLANAEGPMHYVANGIYWAELMHGVSEYQASAEKDYPGRDPREIFSAHAVLGAVAGDVLPAVVLTDDELSPAEHRAEVRRVVEAWLLARQPALQAAFARDMQHLHARYAGETGGAS